METSRLTGQIWTQRVAPYLKSRSFMMGAGYCLFVMLLGRAQLLGGMTPLGLALFIALHMAGLTPVWYPLVGAALGALLCTPIHWTGLMAPAAYVGLCVLYKAWRERVAGNMDKLLLFGMSQLLLLPLTAGGTLDGWLSGLGSLGLSLLLGAAFFRGLAVLRSVQKRRALLEEEQICLCLFIGAAALAVTPAEAWGFSLSLVMLSYVCMFASYARGMQGVAAAVALSGMLVLGEWGEPLIVANLAVCTLCAVFCRRMGRYGVAAAFVLCAAVIGVYVDGVTRQVGLLNALVAGVGFALTPKPMMLAMRAAVDARARELRLGRIAYTRMQRRMAQSLTKTAEAVENIAALLPEKAVESYDRGTEKQYVMQAASHICSDCIRRTVCWREPEEALCAVYDLLPAYSRGLRPRPVAPLESDCPRSMAVAAAVSQAQAQYKESYAKQRLTGAQCAFARRQMAGVSGVIDALADQARADVWQDIEMEQAIAQALDEKGLRIRGISAMRGHNGLQLEITMPLWQEKNRQKIIDCAARTLGRSLRLLQVSRGKNVCILELELARPLTVQVGAATKPKAGSPQSGDFSGRKSLPGGQELLVLSDGMGTGKIARRQSVKAVELLLNLYSLGFSREDALACVNQLRQGDADMYATIDAVHLDLKSGQVEFIKCGAPPCFVLRHGEVYPIYGEALPAGILEEARPAVQRANLNKNDAVVLLTDGALDALGEDTADEIRLNVGSANTPQDAAESLLGAARSRSDADDMSVLVVRVA